MFKLSSILASAAIASSAFTPSNVAAEELKIGVVDMGKVLNETDEAKVKKAEIEKIRDAKKKTLDEKRTALQQMEAKLKEQKVAANSKEAADFRAKAADFTRMAQAADQELKAQFTKTTQGLMEKAKKIISSYASEQKLTVVLEKGLPGRDAVIYNTPSLDITPQVIARFNSQK